MAKTKSELTSLLSDFAQKFGDQVHLFQKIETVYFSKKTPFIKIIKDYKPSQIPMKDFSRAYQYWRRLNEIEEEERMNTLDEFEKEQLKMDALSRLKKMIRNVGGKEKWEQIQFG